MVKLECFSFKCKILANLIGFENVHGGIPEYYINILITNKDGKKISKNILLIM